MTNDQTTNKISEGLGELKKEIENKIDSLKRFNVEMKDKIQAWQNSDLKEKLEKVEDEAREKIKEISQKTADDLQKLTDEFKSDITELSEKTSVIYDEALEELKKDNEDKA